MSEAGGGAPGNDSDVQPLILYNCVHHREDNPIDGLADATAELAAQIYNAVVVGRPPPAQGQLDKIHPLNFASIGAGNLNALLNREVDALAAIARGDAEAQAVLLKNYETLSNELLARTAKANADLVATLGELDAVIREQSPTEAPNRG